MLAFPWVNRVTWPLLAFSLLACGEAFSSSEGAGGSGSSSTSSTVGGGGMTSGCGRPITPVPANWTGPWFVARSSGGRAGLPGCGEEPQDFFDGVMAADANCICSCSIDLNLCKVKLEYDTLNVCGDQSFALLGVDCLANPLGPVGPGFVSLAPAESNVCVPSVFAEKSAPSFDEWFRTCIAPFKEEAGQTCLAESVPNGYGQAVCVGADGVHTCPEGYPVERVMYGSTSDTRACDDGCKCNSGAVTCSGSVEMSANDDGCGGSLSELNANMCAPTGGVSSARFKPVATMGNCQADQQAEPTGVVTPTKPYTLCCDGELL